MAEKVESCPGFIPNNPNTIAAAIGFPKDQAEPSTLGRAELVHRRIHFVHAPVHQAFVDASTFQTSAVASVWVDALGADAE